MDTASCWHAAEQNFLPFCFVENPAPHCAHVIVRHVDARRHTFEQYTGRPASYRSRCAPATFGIVFPHRAHGSTSRGRPCDSGLPIARTVPT